MILRSSEIYRMQKIIDNLQTMIILVDEGLRTKFTTIEERKIEYLLENTTQEFYLITDQIMTRRNENAGTKCS